MSWVVDVSRCLGLMDVGSRDVSRRGTGPSVPFRRQTKSSAWLLGSPLNRGSTQGTPKKRLHRSGSRSTPCLVDEAVSAPLKKQTQADIQEPHGSLTSTPATSSVDSLDTEPPLLPPPSYPAQRPFPAAAGALVMTMPHVPPSRTSRTSLARSCEVLGTTETETLVTEDKQYVSETPARARSVSRLDCSVNYSDSPPLVPAGARDSSRVVFLEARDTLVNRLCGAGSRVPPLPDTEHPTRVFRARRRFASSEHSLSQPPPQRRVSHLKGRETAGGVGGRSRSEHALMRPSWSGISYALERTHSSEWSVWAQELLDSLHQMNANAHRTTSASCPPSTSSTVSSLSSTSPSPRAPLLARSRGSTGGSEDNQVSVRCPAVVVLSYVPHRYLETPRRSYRSCPAVLVPSYLPHWYHWKHPTVQPLS